jgi:hypothetical protein
MAPRASLVGRPVKRFGRPDGEFEIFTIGEPFVKKLVDLFPAAPTPGRWPIEPEPSGVLFQLKDELAEEGGSDCRERLREMTGVYDDGGGNRRRAQSHPTKTHEPREIEVLQLVPCRMGVWLTIRQRRREKRGSRRTYQPNKMQK